MPTLNELANSRSTWVGKTVDQITRALINATAPDGSTVKALPEHVLDGKLVVSGGNGVPAAPTEARLAELRSKTFWGQQIQKDIDARGVTVAGNPSGGSIGKGLVVTDPAPKYPA